MGYRTAAHGGPLHFSFLLWQLIAQRSSAAALTQQVCRVKLPQAAHDDVDRLQAEAQASDLHLSHRYLSHKWSHKVAQAVTWPASSIPIIGLVPPYRYNSAVVNSTTCLCTAPRCGMQDWGIPIKGPGDKDRRRQPAETESDAPGDDEQHKQLAET